MQSTRVKSKADTLAVKEGCYFDEKAASKVCQFFEQFLRHSKGATAGQPFKLQPWQRHLLENIFGWKRPDGTRRYRTGYIEVAKKNGKSLLASGIALYMLVADNENGAEVYCAAVDKQQAGIVFSECKAMVEASPELGKILEVINYHKTIIYSKTKSFIKALSADVGSKEGLNISCGIIDELHRQKSPELFNVLRWGGAARRQPLLLSITTAGQDKNSVCWQQHCYAQQVLDGIIEDSSYFACIYAADPTDDIDSPTTWQKANPSLGVTISLDDFKRELNQAKDDPISLSKFKRYRLNLWTQSDARFIPPDKWEACNTPVSRLELRGETCYAGLDLAATQDFNALVLLFGDYDTGFKVLPFFWIPESAAVSREKLNRSLYDKWASQGYLTITDGEVADYGLIREDILSICDEFNVKKIACDPFNALQLGQQLIAEGIPFEFFRQGRVSMNEPTKELLRLIIERKIAFGDNPILNWMADNAVVEERDSLIKLSKDKSRNKIDGIISLVMALGLAMGDDFGSSIYQERGLLII